MNRRESIGLWFRVTAWQVRSWFERILFCHHNARVLADMEYRFSCVLGEATGGHMSKAYYDWPTMRSVLQSNASAVYDDGYAEGRRDLLEEQAHDVASDIKREPYDPEKAPIATVLGDLKHSIREGWVEKAESLADCLGARLLNKDAEVENFDEAIAAIEFSLTIDDHYEAREFLSSWLQGDTREWPEFTGKRK